ncbi:hypothetical protein ACO0SA_000850 [Hanseniaspora valbyensis]
MYSSLPLSSKDESESNQLKEKTSFYKKIRNWLIIILLSYFIFFKLRFDVIYCQENDECLPIKVNIYQGISKKLFKQSNLPHFPPFFDPKINDSFDLLKPDYKSSHDDKLVHTDYLLDKQEFGHTWGQIYTQSFSPNEIKEDYNFIEMSLSVSINGTQYDRLINIYLNDIMIWRSSTIEPLNRKTTRSFATKDISKYISLFKNNNDGLELKFQLDNLIAGRLDGVFVVDLKIDYYLKDAKDDKENSANLTFFEKSLLNNLNPFSPPDVLKPLFEDKKTYSQVPLLHFPITSNKKHPYKIEDLNISSTTNKLAMELFVSGNAAEEFWYSNVLDEYSKKFDDKGFTTLGHGPVRFLNVYLSNKYDTTKIFNSIPIPVVFTGGFAPSLWKPVVSLGCFDLKAIYIDLSPYLEYLKQDDYFLEFEVVSSNTEEFDIGIGDNWLISGNLLEWEQQDIEFRNTFKELSSFDDYIASAKDDEDYLKQNVTSLSTLNKQFEFIFEGEEYFLQVYTENVLISNISLLDYGASESSILSINSIKKYTVIDKSSEEEILIASDKTNYVFIESLNSTISTDPNIDSVYNTSAVTVYDRNINIENFQLNNDVSILDISASQTGDAVYNISTKCGNHGKGSSVHTINTNRSWPRKDSYSRSVIVKDNKVVIDVIEN